MKKLKCALPIVIIMLLAGCGISAQTHDEVVQERDALREIVLELESEIDILQQNNESLLNDIQMHEAVILTLVEELEEYKDATLVEESAYVGQGQTPTNAPTPTTSEDTLDLF